VEEVKRDKSSSFLFCTILNRKAGLFLMLELVLSIENPLRQDRKES